MMALLVEDSAVNRDRLMKICMVHDLAASSAHSVSPAHSSPRPPTLTPLRRGKRVTEDGGADGLVDGV